MDQIELVRELGSTTCRCGRAKKTRQTFCSQCYYSLPQAMRNALYRRLGVGYEEAYEEAEKHLDDVGRPRAKELGTTRRKLSDSDTMPFGDHKDKPLGKVPNHYWRWFLRQDWSSRYPDLVEYAQIVEDDVDDSRD